jgi:hypothetical protein
MNGLVLGIGSLLLEGHEVVSEEDHSGVSFGGLDLEDVAEELVLHWEEEVSELEGLHLLEDVGELPQDLNQLVLLSGSQLKQALDDVTAIDEELPQLLQLLGSVVLLSLYLLDVVQHCVHTRD